MQFFKKITRPIRNAYKKITNIDEKTKHTLLRISSAVSIFLGISLVILGATSPADDRFVDLLIIDIVSLIIHRIFYNSCKGIETPDYILHIVTMLFNIVAYIAIFICLAGLGGGPAAADDDWD